MVIDKTLTIKQGEAASWTLKCIQSKDWIPMTGTVTIVQGSSTVQGVSTLFTTQIAATMAVLIDGIQYEVLSVTDADTLILKTPAKNSASGVSIFRPDVKDLTGVTLLVAFKPTTNTAAGAAILNELDATDANANYTASISSHTNPTLGITVLSITAAESLLLAVGDYYGEIKEQSTKKVTDTFILKVTSRVVNQRAS